MPIDYSEYHPKWSLISRLIRFCRAANVCEWCKAPNNTLIYRPDKARPELWEMVPFDVSADVFGFVHGHRITKVVLTVAHIDHDKKNNRFGNLAALCQRCHLNHDRSQHIRNRKYGRNHKRHQIIIDF